MGKWDDEEGDSGSPAEETVVPGRRKFDDEEDDDDVLDSWDAAEDSEVEREKEKKAAEAKAKAEAEAKANKKSKAQRVAEKIAEHQKLKEEGGWDGSDEEETEAEKRERLAAAQKEADLKHAEELFGGDVGSVPSGRKATIKGSVVPDPNNPDNLIDLSSLPLFDPKTKSQFETLREVVAPIIANNTNKPQYALFMMEFAKALCKEMQSDQIKKVASGLTTLSNEKMKAEKAQQGAGKKTKAAKTKTTLAMARPSTTTADTTAYDDDAFGDDDFM